LVYKDSSNTWVQIGVVSFGHGGGCLVGPSGFARTASFLGWMSTKIGQGSKLNLTILWEKIYAYCAVGNIQPVVIDLKVVAQI